MNTVYIQIRHVPADVHHQAKLAALLAGQSLNSWLIEAIIKAINNKLPGDCGHPAHPIPCPYTHEGKEPNPD